MLEGRPGVILLNHEVERIGMNAVIPFESTGSFLPVKKGGTAKSTPFVLLPDEGSFLFSEKCGNELI